MEIDHDQVSFQARAEFLARHSLLAVGTEPEEYRERPYRLRNDV